MPTTSFYITLRHFECWHDGCHVAFGLSVDFVQTAEERGHVFHCPNGHRLRFGDSEAVALQRKLDRANERLASEQRRAEELQADIQREAHRVRALRGHITRGRKRVAAGKCLACSHRFDDLATHMAKEHPGFGTKTGAP